MIFAAFGLLMFGAMFLLFDDGSDDDTEAETARVDGTDQDDLLEGNGLDNLITGYQGSDVLFGQDGNDTLRGYQGDDLLIGGDGDDLLLGGVGEDMLLGGDGVDTLDGGSGDDVLIGAQVFSRDFTPDDLATLPGGTLPDQEYNSEPQDEGNTLIGGTGDDLILAGAQDTVTGGDGSDMVQIGEWVRDPQDAVTITDFNSEEDVLVVRYAASGPVPAISIVSDPEDNLLNTVLVNGVAVAHLTSPIGGGGIELNEILLQPIS